MYHLLLNKKDINSDNVADSNIKLDQDYYEWVVPH
jgi:hypothetical protein